MDRKFRAVRPLEPDTSNPATSSQAFGGVARNVAENLTRLGVPTALATLVGDDENGRAILAQARALGLDTSLTATAASHRTAEYTAVLEPDGRLAFGLADMGIFDAFDGAFLDGIRPALAAATWVFADCNLPAELLAALIGERRRSGFRLAIDAVSRAKAVRLPGHLAGVDLLFLNEAEAEALSGEPDPERASSLLQRKGVAASVVTRGASGAILRDESGTRFIPACPARVLDVTGAGDAFIAGTLSALVAGSASLEAVVTGAVLAALTVESEASVRPDLSPQLLHDAMAVRRPSPR